jgi:hypothetical protein
MLLRDVSIKFSCPPRPAGDPKLLTLPSFKKTGRGFTPRPATSFV